MHPIAKVSVVDAAIEQIQKLIFEQNNLEPRGVVLLPSERQLAQQLNISRPTVREALARLRDRRLVMTHHGDGSFAQPPVASGSPEETVDLFAYYQKQGSSSPPALCQTVEFAGRLLSASCYGEWRTRQFIPISWIKLRHCRAIRQPPLPGPPSSAH